MRLRVRMWSLAVATLGLVAFCARHAEAIPLDLAPPGKAPVFSSSVGDARSFIFDADSSFALSSVGIRMDPLISSFTLRADLYAVAPGTLTRVGIPSSSSIQSFTDSGLAFYDVSFTAALLASTRYELELLPPGGFDGQFNMEFFSYQGNPPGSPPDAPYTVGPLTVLDGGGSGVGGPSNFAIAHFRVDVGTVGAAVPQPASLILLALGAAGLIAGLQQ